LDPAQGSFNYQAPGADRYQFSLTLSTRPLDTAVDESQFFELMRVENGQVTKQVKYPVYSEIEKTLARRTFDESGDYAVIPFRASVQESQEANNYIINIEPGKAYVKGFEFETIGEVRLEVEKPRTDGIDTRSIVDIDFDTSYGNYLKFKNVWGRGGSAFLNTKDLETVDLHVTDVANVNIGVSTAANSYFYQNTKIGTASIRAIRRDIAAQDGVANVDSNGVFDFYFTGINLKPKVFISPGNGSANTINIGLWANRNANAYQNVSVTVLPIQLTPVASSNAANVLINSVVVTDAGANFSGSVAVGDIIRVDDEVRQVVNVATTTLLVNSAFTKTVIGGGANANVRVYVQTAYSSNVTNQTRMIARYDGTTQLAYLDRAWDDNAVPITNTVLQLNYGIENLKSWIKANATQTAANAHANIAIQSLLIDGKTEMFETSRRKTLFRLPQNTVKRGSLTGVEYNSIKYFADVAGTVGVNSVFTLGPLEQHEQVAFSSTNSNLEDNLLVIVRDGTVAAANGRVEKIAASQVVITEGPGGQLVITLPNSITRIDAYVLVNQLSAHLRVRGKKLRSNSTITQAPFTYPDVQGSSVTADYTVTVPNVLTAGVSSPVAKINVANGLIYITEPKVTNIFPGDSISLYTPDVVNIRAVLKGNTTNVALSDIYEDITDHFVVDLGQTEETYEHAKLILKQGYPSPNAQLTVHVDFFEHTYQSNSTYFSAESYEESVYQAGQIPVFFSETSGTYFLRDCLDFRSTRQIGVSTGAYQTGILPDPNATTEISFQYYLPRIDKLVLSKNKEFRILKGVASPAPIPPDDSEDAMTLYTIYLAPFVATTEDIRLRYNENRRYTMKDISRIDKRVESLEYYTSLNNIEGRAMGDSTKYEDGTDKTKYGIIGEGFKNFNIASYKDPDFACSMDEGEMGPFIGNMPFGMKMVANTGLRVNERTVTLNFTEEDMVVQPVTSNKLVSVQPFLFAQFIGDVRLSPEMDFWVSEELKPDVLRAPEIDDRIREIYNSERAAERAREPVPQAQVPTPTRDAASTITTVPGVDPPAANVVFTVPMAPARTSSLIPSITFSPPSTKKRKRSLFDNIKLLFPVRQTTAPAPIPPAPSSPLPVYSAPISAPRVSGGGGGGFRTGFTQVNMV
jgi:hypothetical protein